MDYPSHVIPAQATGTPKGGVMQQAGSPADETIRLACLTQYDILDTPSEQGFDDIVLLASRICEAPVALVSLVAEDRQWFKARLGFDAPQTPLSQSVCAHGLRQPGLLVIPDLTADSRTRGNTLVTGKPFIRFYAGARLEAPGGMAIGMLCVIDTKPRAGGLKPDQASSLEALARQVMSQMELKRAIGERELLVQEAHHRVKNSLQMVQSLLSLQARMTAYPEAAQQLRESATRISAFGAMHEHLYQVGAAVEIDLCPYLGDLVNSQNEALVSTMIGRDIVFDAESAVWAAADAPTVGLILMELVTNALKYGTGMITVTLRSIEDDIVLSVEDEGTSLPADFTPSQGKGLGMRVLTGFLNGRRGRLTIDRSRGHTCFVATLQRPEAKR